VNFKASRTPTPYDGYQVVHQSTSKNYYIEFINNEWYELKYNKEVQQFCTKPSGKISKEGARELGLGNGQSTIHDTPNLRRHSLRLYKDPELQELLNKHHDQTLHDHTHQPHSGALELGDSENPRRPRYLKKNSISPTTLQPILNQARPTKEKGKTPTLILSPQERITYKPYKEQTLSH
jgi:hypothetical protein